MRNISEDIKVESQLYAGDSEFITAIQEELEAFFPDAMKVQKSMHAAVDRMEHRIDCILESMPGSEGRNV